MHLEAGPTFRETSLEALRDNGIRPYLVFRHLRSPEALEHITPTGRYMVPPNLTHVAIGGGAAQAPAT
jgi:hypothetical protein